MKYKNNPLNVRNTGIFWQGRDTHSNKPFLEFVELKYGIRCALYLLYITYPKRGWNTIRDIIYHWAPASDGNSPSGYLHFVCSGAGVISSEVFSNLSIFKQYLIVREMCMMETKFYLNLDDFEESKKLLPVPFNKI